jgi:hypothetical protein
MVFTRVPRVPPRRDVVAVTPTELATLNSKGRLDTELTIEQMELTIAQEASTASRDPPWQAEIPRDEENSIMTSRAASRQSGHAVRSGSRTASHAYAANPTQQRHNAAEATKAHVSRPSANPRAETRRFDPNPGRDARPKPR